MTTIALKKEVENLKNENAQLRRRLTYKCPNCENSIKNNNEQQNEYLKKINADILKLKKVLRDKNKGIEPDSELVERIRNSLIEAGILDKKGGLAAPYKNED